MKPWTKQNIILLRERKHKLWVQEYSVLLLVLLVRVQSPKKMFACNWQVNNRMLGPEMFLLVHLILICFFWWKEIDKAQSEWILPFDVEMVLGNWTILCADFACSKKRWKSTEYWTRWILNSNGQNASCSQAEIKKKTFVLLIQFCLNNQNISLHLLSFIERRRNGSFFLPAKAMFVSNLISSCSSG